MEYLTTIEMSKEWGISSRRIAILCEQNRIEGVIKKGKTWLIPNGSIKPADARKNNHSQRGTLKC
ncbi:MAG: DNA-binding protein [Lachnospiraceae bacterium]|nr:DNA-binding protein [Lachnospiraceae bacterium]